jgi:hypothetical protein
VLALMIAGLAAHAVTAYRDTAYAATRRVIAPIEQHIHSFQEVIPLMAFSIVAILHWDQFAALVTLGEQARFVFEWKRVPLPAGYVAGVLAAALLFEVLPFMEEFWRGRKRSRGLPPPGNRA